MKAVVINGSPRKNGNTMALIQSSVDGLKSAGVETELVHLYDLSFKGCMSCMGCKRRCGEKTPSCLLKDSLTPLIGKIHDSEILILGSPVYFGNVTSHASAMIERLLFPLYSYDSRKTTLYRGNLKTGLIITMGASPERAVEMGYDQVPGRFERYITYLLGSCQLVSSLDTMILDDPEKFDLNPEELPHKTRIKSEVFPMDCEKAYQMGRNLALN